MGLSGSGKTTYLAALWHYLESAEVADTITVPHLQPDRDYLNAIRNNWLALRPVGRTSLRMRRTVSMILEESESAATIEVALPDLSGESFRLQWSTRRAPQDYVRLAQECTGAFLFIHAADFRRTHVIKPKPMDDSVETYESSAAIPISDNWTSEQSSTQVQLLDILQLMLGLRKTDDAPRLAVIVSAWDLVRVPVTPVGWLDSRLPLLSQFLRANQDWLPSEVFGVSSQGGDLNSDREKLLSSSTASARCQAVRGDSLNAVSISAPLLFLLNLKLTREVQ
jgi:hypothetical protein